MYRSRLLLLAALIIGASLVFMQAASAAGMLKAGAGPGTSYMDRMTKALDLTPDQVSKIQAIHKDARVKREAVLANKSLTPDQRRTQLADIRKSTHTQIMGVLTPEQQKKYHSFLSEKRAKMESAKVALNLTADQKAKLAAIRQTTKQQVATVSADTSLSATQKAAKIREIHRSAKQQMDAVLTTEQKAKLGEAREHRVK